MIWRLVAWVCFTVAIRTGALAVSCELIGWRGWTLLCSGSAAFSWLAGQACLALAAPEPVGRWRAEDELSCLDVER